VTSTLLELKPGHTGRVLEVSGQNGSGRRMMAMGLTPGTVIRVDRVAPLGDPIEITVRGYKLLLRKAEALNILVQI
jgi:Fe2+ transport system protein FeoA